MGSSLNILDVGYDCRAVDVDWNGQAKEANSRPGNFNRWSKLQDVGNVLSLSKVSARALKSSQAIRSTNQEQEYKQKELLQRRRMMTANLHL